MKKKILRQITAILPIHESRRGECLSCGACCKLPYRCPMLRDRDDGSTYCAIYPVRPPSCRKYPRSAGEHVTGATCGFYFDEEAVASVAACDAPADA